MVGEEEKGWPICMTNIVDGVDSTANICQQFKVMTSDSRDRQEQGGAA